MLREQHEEYRLKHQPTSQVFVLYPRGVRTGGPEALHQLVDTLRSFDVDAYLVPFPQTRSTPRCKEHSRYNAPEAGQYQDLPGNTIVFPEVIAMKTLQIRQARPILWWLSVDNSYAFAPHRRLAPDSSPSTSIQERLLAWAAQPAAYLLRRCLRQRRIVHATQSTYAWSHVFALIGSTPSMLTDFIPQETFLSPAPQPQRNPYRVCYNPKKGAKILARVREALGSTFEWLPLEGMDREEVGNALHGAGISLDLGHHPGKDRMPREAALAGALTIVSRTGSGAFEADVPLPWEHKFPLDPAGIARLIDQLPKLASQLAQEIRKQDPYRKAIAREHVRFRQEVEDIFLRRRYGQGPH